MKKARLIRLGIVPALAVTLAACNSDGAGNGVVTQAPGSAAAVNDNAGKEAGKPEVSVKTIDRYEKIAITDWMDDETVIVSKDNEDLGTMSLEELSASYPKSLYLYHLDTKRYELLKEQKNAFLGGAVLSSDRKHLLYSEFSLGDPVYHVLNLEALESFGIVGDPIGGAMSASWADDGTVVGAAYSGGAYKAGANGEIEAVTELNGEALVIVRQMKEWIYYNTNSDESLQVLDLSTKEKTDLKLDHVYDVIPSPDGKQLLVLQHNDAKQTMVLCDADGGNRKILAEGAELGGVSWSPDRRMIAYSLKADGDGTTANGLHLYDLSADKAIPIAGDLGNVTTSWSPSGMELAYTEWSGDQPDSGIVHFAHSERK